MKKWISVGKINNEDVSYQETEHGNWLWIGTNEADIQRLAPNSLDYGYTHGGEIYKKACQMVWKKQQA